MNRTNNILRAAVLAAFGVAAGQAGATVDYSVSPATGVTKFAKEIPTNTTALANAGNALDIKVSVPAGYNIATTAPLYVKIQLSPGATFKGTPVLGCNTYSAATVTGISAGAITVGGNGDSAVTFNVGAVAAAAGTTATTTGTCVVSGFTGIGIVSGTSRDVNFSATVEYKNGLSDVASGASGAYITFVNGFTAVISSGGSIVVDATSGSDNFSAGGGAISTTLASAGLVSWVAVGTSAATATTVGNIGVGDVLGTSSGSITVSGPSVAAALATNGVSGVYLDISTADSCATKSYTVASTATNSVTFSSITTAHISSVSGLVVCLNVSGASTQIATGALTATVGGGLQTNVTHSFTNDTGSLSTLTQNGTTKNAYFVNASTSTNKTSVIRIVNTGGNSGTVRATAYLLSNDGTPVGTATGTANSTIATLAANESISLSSAQLETLLGLTPADTTTKYRVVFSAGLAGFKVLNYTKDVATGNITLSQAQDD